jgi:hypothetical protein
LSYPSGDTGCDTNDGNHNLCQANRVYLTVPPPSPAVSCLGGVVAIELLQFPYPSSGSVRHPGPSPQP